MEFYFFFLLFLVLIDAVRAAWFGDFVGSIRPSRANLARLGGRLRSRGVQAAALTFGLYNLYVEYESNVRIPDPPKHSRCHHFVANDLACHTYLNSTDGSFAIRTRTANRNGYKLWHPPQGSQETAARAQTRALQRIDMGVRARLTIELELPTIIEPGWVTTLGYGTSARPIKARVSQITESPLMGKFTDDHLPGVLVLVYIALYILGDYWDDSNNGSDTCITSNTPDTHDESCTKTNEVNAKHDRHVSTGESKSAGSNMRITCPPLGYLFPYVSAVSEGSIDMMYTAPATICELSSNAILQTSHTLHSRSITMATIPSTTQPISLSIYQLRSLSQPMAQAAIAMTPIIQTAISAPVVHPFISRPRSQNQAATRLNALTAASSTMSTNHPLGQFQFPALESSSVQTATLPAYSADPFPTQSWVQPRTRRTHTRTRTLVVMTSDILAEAASESEPTSSTDLITTRARSQTIVVMSSDNEVAGSPLLVAGTMPAQPQLQDVLPFVVPMTTSSPWSTGPHLTQCRFLAAMLARMLMPTLSTTWAAGPALCQSLSLTMMPARLMMSTTSELVSHSGLVSRVTVKRSILMLTYSEEADSGDIQPDGSTELYL